MHEGPVVIGYDGTAAAERAIRESGALLAGRPALVLVVYKQGLGFELIELPAASIGLPPAALDVRTALEVDRVLAEHSRQLAQKGAGLARDSGYAAAEGLAVADDVETPVAETIVDVARERDAPAVVVGAHGHGALSEVLLGSTSREVVRRAESPVVIVRDI
jgi:nucleotide-binding universal stress UspA family protein